MKFNKKQKIIIISLLCLLTFSFSTLLLTNSDIEPEKEKNPINEINNPKGSNGVFFEENFEGDLSNWADINGLWKLNDTESYSPTHSMWFGNDTTGNYNTGERELGNITSVPINLLGESAAYLEFYQWREVEEDEDFDLSYVFISTDGTNWIEIYQSYENIDPWDNLSFDISAFCGYSSVQICFHFDSLDELYNDYKGWFIDDIRITSTAPTDDNYEENDDYTEAYDLTSHENEWLYNINGYGIQADDDWYEIYASAGETLYIDCLFYDAEGDIDMELYNNTYIDVDGSYTTTDNEHIIYAVPTSGTYYILVYFGDEGNRYDLKWYASYTGPADDNYEDNDVYTDACNLTSHENEWLNTIDGYGIQADGDWYEIYANIGELHLIVELVFSHMEGNLNISIYNSTGAFIMGTDTSTNNELIDYTLPSNGTYYILVSGEGQYTIYSLRWRTNSGYNTSSGGDDDDDDDGGEETIPGYDLIYITCLVLGISVILAVYTFRRRK